MTSEEIVKSLRHCATVDGSGCYECPAGDSALKSELDCDVLMKTEAAGLIERLEKDRAALMEYAKKSAGCEQCANYRTECTVVDCFFCLEDCQCKKCKKGSAWRWKGLEDENDSKIIRVRHSEKYCLQQETLRQSVQMHDVQRVCS